MKKIPILLAILFAAVLAQGQATYKYVIIPTSIPGIAAGIDPYGISSTMQNVLNSKQIESVFASPERPDDYCEALIAYIEKGHSLLRNKVMIELRDCMNRVIWSGEGTGVSKEFRAGYGEAVADALATFVAMPAIEYAVKTTPAVAPVTPQPVQQVSPPAAPPVAVQPGQGAVYQPKNIYYNEKYLVDYVSDAQGNHQLVVLNGAALGYEKFKTIATLVPSDLPGILTVKWTRPDGEVWSGLANEVGTELKISIGSGDTKEIISLQKQ